VRVDGYKEFDGERIKRNNNNDNNNNNEFSSSCGTGSLDGLTFGSDHRFDMSLCASR
jgi:hypothetical protein